MKHHRVLSLLFLLACIGLPKSLNGDQPSGDDRKSIIGVWKGSMPEDRWGVFEITITASKITGRNLTNGQSMGAGTYHLDTVKKTIDARGIENPVRGKTFLGLYSLDGD